MPFRVEEARARDKQRYTGERREVAKARATAWNREHPEARRTIISQANLKATLRRHGLTLDEYEDLLVAQDGRCALCGRSVDPKCCLDGKPIRLSIDHDHETGRVRGLLCTACNRIIGYIGRDAWLERAAAYLATATPA